MSSGYKNPPKFEEDRYEQWKSELEIWQLVTDLESKKRALAVTLSLTGKAREAALNIKSDELNSEDGMKKLLKTLDKLYLKETIDSTYEEYKSFDTFRKQEDMSMSEYIMEFDRRYERNKRYEMSLPDAVLAFKLMDNANLTKQEKQLALTACSELKYDNMKSALKRIFGESSHSRSENENILIKQESVMYTARGKYNSRPTRPFHAQRQGSSDHQSTSTKDRQMLGPNNQYGYAKGTNPMNKYGKHTRCSICQSVCHWWRDCPHKTQSEAVLQTDGENSAEKPEECNITLMTEEIAQENNIFIAESQNSAVIDTACTRTVCGEKWLNNYLKYCDDSAVSSVYSKKPFRFGDGKIQYSFQKVKLPAKIGKTRCNIESEVVKADIPLLLSKASLKKAGTQLDLNNDTAIMFNNPIKLHLTSSGHYCVDLIDRSNEQNFDAVQNVLLLDEDMDIKDKVKMLKKIHAQFGHASSDKLKNLIKSAGHNNQKTFQMLETIVQECSTCLKHKRPGPRPVVGLPLASDYNETVAVDLHQLEPNVWYLHIIDEFSRYSAGCITYTKKAEKIVQYFIKHWIAIHGAPKRVFSDNGGEFENHEFKEMAEEFNMELLTTPAYSPWSNGLLERHNQTLTDILLKLKYDKSLDWETALCWALMAKNNLHNVQGFSPQQLVFARNPNLPSVLIDAPPALEGSTSSRTVGNHISALYAARQAFTQAECSEKIRRALRRQTRPTPDICEPGDKVYYKRPDGQEWKGPGTVIGQDGPLVFVRHGGSLVRVHKCRLRNLSEKIEQSEQDNMSQMTRNNCDHHSMHNGNNSHNSVTEINDSDSESDVTPTYNGIDNDIGAERQIKVKPGQLIQYKHAESEETVCAKIINRAGKSKGAHKNWFNVQCLQPKEIQGAKISVDLSKVQDLKIITENVNNEHHDQEDTVLVIDEVNWCKAKKR